MRENHFTIPFNDPSIDGLSAILNKPSDPYAMVMMAHGAGAGINHSFMHKVAELMYERDLAVLRFNFPYMQAGRKRPDPQRKSVTAWLRAINFQLKQTSLPLFIGGKSYGGRMASWVAADNPDLPVYGLIYWGFPLHAPGKPYSNRADHLRGVAKPMLFLQGSRDALADLNLLRPIIPQIPSANIHIQEGADHSFRVLKTSNRTDEEVLIEISNKVAKWTKKIVRDAKEEEQRSVSIRPQDSSMQD